MNRHCCSRRGLPRRGRRRRRKKLAQTEVLRRRRVASRSSSLGSGCCHRSPRPRPRRPRHRNPRPRPRPHPCRGRYRPSSRVGRSARASACWSSVSAGRGGRPSPRDAAVGDPVNVAVRSRLAATPSPQLPAANISPNRRRRGRSRPRPCPGPCRRKTNRSARGFYLVRPGGRVSRRARPWAVTGSGGGWWCRCHTSRNLRCCRTWHVLVLMMVGWRLSGHRWSGRWGGAHRGLDRRRGDRSGHRWITRNGRGGSSSVPRAVV